MRAAVPITKGSRITLDNNSGSMSGTLQRQRFIKRTKFGCCRCQRCSDPTELSTFTSGIYCLRCPNREGILLPEYPLNHESDWMCNKCSDRKSAKFVNDLLEIAGKDLDDLDSSSVTECEAFVMKYEKVFHPNHCVLIQVKFSLFESYDFFKNNPQLGINGTDVRSKPICSYRYFNLIFFFSGKSGQKGSPSF